MKQVILVRQDLKMPKGKLAAQVAHASVEAVLSSTRTMVEEWRQEGMAKIVLKVKDMDELRLYHRELKKQRIITALIRDAGRTYFEIPTTTCLGVGPDKDEKIDKITGNLKML